MINLRQGVRDLALNAHGVDDQISRQLSEKFCLLLMSITDAKGEKSLPVDDVIGDTSLLPDGRKVVQGYALG